MDTTDFDLGAYQWQHRLLLVFAPTVEDTAYETQIALFAADSAALADRDLLLGHIFADGSSRIGEQVLTTADAKRLRQRFEVTPNQFAAILVGKDGTEKRRDEAPVKPDVIYAEIDAMPMRQREMRERGQQ